MVIAVPHFALVDVDAVHLAIDAGLPELHFCEPGLAGAIVKKSEDFAEQALFGYHLTDLRVRRDCFVNHAVSITPKKVKKMNRRPGREVCNLVDKSPYRIFLILKVSTLIMVANVVKFLVTLVELGLNECGPNLCIKL